jgi:RNA polymerase sigma-70 factor (ECF subfamily)
MSHHLIQQLWREHRLGLQAFFRRRHSSRRDAADLTQEVYLRLLRATDERHIANPEAYLFTVARNLLHEHAVAEQRQARRVTLDDPVVVSELTLEPNLDRQLDHASQLRVLREAIRELQNPQQAALIMAYQNDMSYAEIALKLDVHRSMVGKYIAQALNLCRRRLRKQGAP